VRFREQCLVSTRSATDSIARTEQLHGGAAPEINRDPGILLANPSERNELPGGMMTTNQLQPIGTAQRLGYAAITDQVLQRVRERAEEAFQCGRYSLHGQTHWQRVEATGLDLARQTGADPAVVRLFAVLHDCCRHNDGRDPEHGARAAEFLASLVGPELSIDPNRLCLLEQALRYHADGHTTDDPTIGTCWDADRLDLGRVGKRPDPELMSTEPGKRRAQLR
jgi:uncharacterized protein